MTNYLTSSILKNDLDLGNEFDYIQIDQLLQQCLSKQILVVVPESNLITGFLAKVSLYQYQCLDHVWQLDPKIKQLSAVLGKKGIVAAQLKTEGDGMTPTGLYNISELFGYSLISPNKYGMPYRPILDKLDDDGKFWDKFIDDSNSSEYNSWVGGRTLAQSFEEMRVAGHKDGYAAYEYGAILDYNMKPIIPGKGSAIFLHIYKNPFLPTEGCIALAKNDILTILNCLKPNYFPNILILPEYSLLN